MSPLPAKSRRIRRPKQVSPERWAAWRVVLRTFDEDAYADRILDAEAERMQLDTRQRAQCQHLAFGTVRAAKRMDWVIGSVGKRPLTKIEPSVLAALRMGIFQLLESDGVADHAAVDQTVEIVRAATGERAVAFANAVMRRAQVDGVGILGKLDPEKSDDAATLLSYPQWIVDRMVAAHGEQGQAALEAQNTPVTVGTPIRLNGLRTAADSGDVPDAPWNELLPEARIARTVDASFGAAIDRGEVIPQSFASMVVGRIVDPEPGMRVLDMCAAPGGKTTHLAALQGPDGEIVACELHDHRADQLRELVDRLGASGTVRVECIDARTVTAETHGMFDVVLLDAPCSGLGVMGRRPDARWKRTEDDVDSLIVLQRELLRSAASVLAPGGALVYSTCTLVPEENEQQVAWAISELDLEPESLPGTWHDIAHPNMSNAITTWPQRDGTDGFFIARLRRGGADVAAR